MSRERYRSPTVSICPTHKIRKEKIGVMEGRTEKGVHIVVFHSKRKDRPKGNCYGDSQGEGWETQQGSTARKNQVNVVVGEGAV